MLTKDTDFATKGSLSILLFKYRGRFCLLFGNVERINTILSILCHLQAAKVRVSNIAIHPSTSKTLVKLVFVNASVGEKGCMNSIDAINFINCHTAQGRQSCKEREKEKKDVPPFFPLLVGGKKKKKRFQNGSMCLPVLLQFSAKLM